MILNLRTQALEVQKDSKSTNTRIRDKQLSGAQGHTKRLAPQLFKEQPGTVPLTSGDGSLDPFLDV